MKIKSENKYAICKTICFNYFGKTPSKWTGHSKFTCLGQTTGAKCAWKVLLRSVIGMPWSIGGNSSISINVKNYVNFLKFLHTNTEKLANGIVEGVRKEM